MKPTPELGSPDSRTLKIVAGFALVYDLWNGRSTPELQMLYDQPSLQAFRQIHLILQSSDDYRDREAAIWLMLAFEVPEPKLDLQDVVNELQEMEFIVRRLIPRSSGALQADLNLWMDHLANAAVSLNDSYWLDAKMDLNRALSLAMGPGIQRMPSTSGISHELSLLRNETERLFLVVRDIPVRLSVPEERLDLVIGIQQLLIKAIALQRREVNAEQGVLAQTARDINQALRQALRKGEAESSVMDQLRLVSSRLEMEMEKRLGEPGVEALGQLRDLAKAIVQTPS